MNKDTIYREDAIKALTEVLFDEPPYLNSIEKCEAFARKTLEDIPSAEENIPTSIKQAYARGYNHAKEEIALSGEYERAYKRGRESVLLQSKQGEWTPCSERPPEEKGKYLVTEKVYAITDNNHAGKYSVLVEEVAYDPVFYKHSGGWARTRTKYETVAWMPLPEPWEGADNDSI